MAFCVPVPIADGETMNPVTVAIEKSDALTDKPARELAGGISGTEQNGDVTISPTIRALWKCKPDLMGAVVLHRMAEVGGITHLACHMVKRKNS